MLDFGKKLYIFDGAMGTMLQERGLKAGEIPELLNITHPSDITEIHKMYIKSGADIITTNTFGANEYKLKDAPYSVEEVIDSAVKNAKNAVGENQYVALDIGPIGELVKPLGEMSFEEAYNIFKRQAVQGEKSGADLCIIETMTNLSELRAAILAVKENTSLKVVATMSFEETGRTFTGCLAESFVTVCEGMGVDAVGVNCSLGPKELKPVIQKILNHCNIPVIVQPNAGLPVVVDGKTVYNITEEDFVRYMEEFYEMGVSIFGGCCGTNPSYINKLSGILKGREIVKREKNNISSVCTATKYVNIDSVKVIGERINPTGKKLFKQALIDKDMGYIVNQAISQVKDGADILDVNVGLPGINEEELMLSVMDTIEKVTDTPLQIDSSNPDVIEKALRIYNGKAIVNSVNGEQEVLDRVLPLVKKYGASVVGLTMSEDGIPETYEKRVGIAEKIINEAEKYGIKKEDIYIDCLTLTASAQQEAVFETVKALKEVKEKFGVKTVLGVSNISFGLPKREVINQTFLSTALSYGLDLPIINPGSADMMNTIYAFNVLNNTDKNAAKYISVFSDVSSVKTKETAKKKELKEIVIDGLKDFAEESVLELIEKEEPFDIVDKYLIPALDIVGEKYEKGEIFLPQLIQSAETVKVCVNVIKEKTKEDTKIIKGKIILATVKGDVHDIGKNIVKIILENYGYEIIDLGKDVSRDEIIEVIKSQNVKLVGLSALMTTTVVNMEDTIKKIKETFDDVTVMVGGAVLTKEYADSIGADFYGKDAKTAAEIANKVFLKF